MLDSTLLSEENVLFIDGIGAILQYDSYYTMQKEKGISYFVRDFMSGHFKKI
tara:strand:+ start:259 stop:414 length:156 start_codon:yes stop_codon:yes gene_type:complete